MTPDEILRIPPDEELVFIRGQKVFRAHRFDYSKHTHYNKLKNTKSIYHEPAWKQIADGQAFAIPAIYDTTQETDPMEEDKSAEEPTAVLSEVEALGLKRIELNEIMKKGR